MQTEPLFFHKHFLCYILLLCWYTYNQLVYIPTIKQDNRTSEWKVQSKLLISWEHLGVLKIDWNDQKLKQFLWIVYCNTHSFLDKSNLNHYENWKKKYFHIRCGLYWMWWIPISMISFFRFFFVIKFNVHEINWNCVFLLV